MLYEPPVASPPTAIDLSQEADRAQQETPELLEWHRVCDHLSGFATGMGRAAARVQPLPPAWRSRKPAWPRPVKWRCSMTSPRGAQLPRRAGPRAGGAAQQQGGVASGEELLAVAETLAAARRLRRQIDDPELRPVCTALIETMVTLPELEQRLKFALEEGGRVADRASSALSALRHQWNGLRQERRDKLQELLRRLAPSLQDSVIAERHGRPVLAEGRCREPGAGSGARQFVLRQHAVCGTTLGAHDGQQAGGAGVPHPG